MNREFNLGLGLDKDARIAADLTELVGNTPMLTLGGYAKHYGFETDLVAKLEYFNPLGSVKDRVGVYMIERAERKAS